MSAHRTLRVVLVLQMAILISYAAMYAVYTTHVADDYGILVRDSPMRTAMNALFLAVCTSFGNAHEFTGATIRSRNIILMHSVTNMIFIFWAMHAFVVQGALHKE